ncbi:hypothetical protein [Burkholderia sp. SCN-KJ]|uniref:hypothetical protein n=1 Tax=Burkholderia sp. SCN-KJ TaxID=2969248 RepID=UPI00214F888F|nr:hypothetical protein [Burkholderia sp. SCN-KJ]MCR4470484.1 hypothetical protein [Burkholderia sp. SCN-KJ]
MLSDRFSIANILLKRCQVVIAHPLNIEAAGWPDLKKTFRLAFHSAEEQTVTGTENTNRF